MNLSSARVRTCTIGLVCPVVALAASAHAAPTFFNGHAYEFVQVDDPLTGNNNSWDTASAAAAVSQFLGADGYLATITSQAENDFLFSLVSGQFSVFAGAWLGGNAATGWLVGPEAGQALTYTNFGGSEPNNSGLMYMNIGALTAGIDPGKWVDDSGVQGVPSVNDPVVGYFVEYSVPAPGGAIALLAGAPALLRRRR